MKTFAFTKKWLTINNFIPQRRLIVLNKQIFEIETGKLFEKSFEKMGWAGRVSFLLLLLFFVFLLVFVFVIAIVVCLFVCLFFLVDFSY